MSGAKTREILIVGPSSGSAQLRDAVRKHLDHALQGLPGAPFDWSFSGVESPHHLAGKLGLEEAPLLVLLDPEKSDMATQDSTWAQLCSGIRRLDPSCCVLVLANNESPSAEQSIRWLDCGANGLLHLGSPLTSTEDPLRDMLSSPLRVKVPRKVRMTARHKVELHVASLEQALVAETLNIGLGGLFIRSVPQGVAIGDEVEFVLQFSSHVSGQTAPENADPLVSKMNEEGRSDSASQTAPKPNNNEIRGTGSVVWVRSTRRDNEPEGIGLKFEEVEASGFKKLQDFIASHRISAFIPKA